MLMKTQIYTVLILLVFTMSVHADFLPHHTPTSDFEVGKVDTDYAFTYRSWLPIKPIDGHIDVQAWNQSFIAKVEGGYPFGHHLSLRGYTQYRTEWIDVGGNLEYRLHRPGLHIHSGVGIWTENSFDDNVFGTRAYIHFRVKNKLTVNTDVLVSDDFKKYRVYSRPVIDIPITPHLAVLVSGEIEYNETFNWQLKSGVRVRW